jgi:PIN domain nuclease of toxin-antitoxin system
VASSNTLLIDTHVWVWALADEARLGRASASLLQRAARRGEVLVSIISVWEIAMLVERGRLRLALEVGAWVEQALTAPGIVLAQLTPTIAIDSTLLPGKPPSDPADRIMIATARKTGAILLSADRALLKYAEAGHVLCRDARL